MADSNYTVRSEHEGYKNVGLMEMEDNVYAVCMMSGSNSFQNITTTGTTVVKSGAGTLGKIIFNQPVAASVVTIYDNTAASGTKIGTITLPATLLGPEPEREYAVNFSNGLTIDVGVAASDITVTYI